MPSVTNEYFDHISAIEFKQGKYKFYVFKMKARDLLKIAYTSPRTKNNRKGIQRGLDVSRLKDIGEYVQNEEKPNLLPNAIIVNFSKNTKYENGKILIFKPKDKASEAFILDGQHRLFAFDPAFSNNVNFDLIVAGFIDLKDDECAYLFRTINEKQKKINPSLVFDLIPMLRKDWVEFEDQRAQYLVEQLNLKEDSPWYDGISMLGGREKTITLSSFMTRLKSLFKKDKIFFDQNEEDDFYFSTVQYTLLFVFFNAVKKIYPESWLNKNFILCKNTGVAVLLNLLDEIIKDMSVKKITIVNNKGLVITESDFFKYIKKIEKISFGDEYGTRYLGEAGIRELTKELHKMMF